MARGSVKSRHKDRNDVWRIRIYLGTDANGKQKYHREEFHGPKKAAEARLTELLREIDTGGYVEPVKLTVGSFLDRWMSEAVVPYKKPTTVTQYEHSVRRMAPVLGHIPLQKLRPLDLQTYYRKALESGRADGSGGLSPSTVRMDYRTIHKALEDAVKWGLVARNVADATDPPSTRPKTRNVWTNEEVARFLETASTHRLYALYALALTTGLRRGELFGLRRRDVDLESVTVTVRQTIVVTDGKYHVQTLDDGDDATKTQTSADPISISPAVAVILKEHIAKQAEERLGLGSKYKDQGFLFAQANGNHLRPDQFTKRDFPRMCERAGVPRIRFHDMRHTYATRLLNEKIPLQVVQRRMRHADVSTTIRNYGHVVKEVERQAAEVTDDILPKTRRSEQAK